MPARLVGAAAAMASAVSHAAFPRMQDSTWHIVGGEPWLIQGLGREDVGFPKAPCQLG